MVVKKKSIKPKDNMLINVSFALNLGFILALPPIIFTFIGLYLDKIFNSKPYLTIIFILLGVLTSILAAFKEAKKFLK